MEALLWSNLHHGGGGGGVQDHPWVRQVWTLNISYGTSKQNNDCTITHCFNQLQLPKYVINICWCYAHSHTYSNTGQMFQMRICNKSINKYFNRKQ